MELPAATKPTNANFVRVIRKKCSMNQGCHKRFYRHMFFRIIYFFPFETSATASCGYMLNHPFWGKHPYFFLETPIFMAIFNQPSNKKPTIPPPEIHKALTISRKKTGKKPMAFQSPTHKGRLVLGGVKRFASGWRGLIPP